MKIPLNENFKNLSRDYLFAEIDARVKNCKQKNPQKEVISLGIGDVSRPISPSVANEMQKCALMMATKDGFFGYGASSGLTELREALSSYYAERKTVISPTEIFISDGAKSNLGALCDLFGDCEVLICDPVYPVYLDVSIIHGRRVHFLRASAENSYLPMPDALPEMPFLIYLCSPNNPTGAVYSRDQLKKWVDFALVSGSLIIFDVAYEAYVSNKSLPRSIYEIEGAKKCAIEVGSFSKMAGFTGVRCGWSVVPSKLPVYEMWKRRQSTKFNGASYLSQRGALASLLPRGREENFKNIEYYMENARLIARFLTRKGIEFSGGEHAPYLWFKCPKNMDSWTFFDYILNGAGVVGAPGVGFGVSGEGYFRFTSFASREDTEKALELLDKII